MIDFLEQQSLQKIVIEESGGTVRLHGNLQDSWERDMSGRSLLGKPCY
ncbi:MAG: hypothetical protein MK434_07510 [SAR324 cluster bacterium]|uniref:Uncharacterized protein n=1 Tax=marine metagenome TaxID=408172 RepID=A0A382E165_9ZZZZ|nr:hypothetical protein [SAR324 cluster bacterium]MCS5553417.1 hypothetical protein [SAR324 cluster bacterium]